MSEDEATRRRRVVHGWAFRGHDEAVQQEIRAWLAGGDKVPSGYEDANKVTEVKNGRRKKAISG